MGKLFRKSKDGQVIEERTVPVFTKKSQVQETTQGNQKQLVQNRSTTLKDKIGSIVQKKAPAFTQKQIPVANAQKKTIASKPGNEIVLKATVKLPDTQKTASMTDYKKAVQLLKDEAAKSDFNTVKLESMIAGEQRTTVLKTAEQIRIKLTQ